MIVYLMKLFLHLVHWNPTSSKELRLVQMTSRSGSDQSQSPKCMSCILWDSHENSPQSHVFHFMRCPWSPLKELLIPKLVWLLCLVAWIISNPNINEFNFVYMILYKPPFYITQENFSTAGEGGLKDSSRQKQTSHYIDLLFWFISQKCIQKCNF